MLTTNQLSQLIYGEIEKNVVLDEVKKGRNNRFDKSNQKRFRK